MPAFLALLAEAEAANAKAKLSSIEALNAHLQLLIGKLEREKHGPRRERTQRLIDQLELQLEELVASAAEDELGAQEAAAKTQSVRAFARKRPVRKPWPEDVERERIVIEAPMVMCLLWRLAVVEAGRGCDGNAGGDPAPLQGH